MKALPKYNLDRNFELLILAGILVLSALLRLHNLSYGQGAHPDERHMVSVTEGLKPADLNPDSFAYGSFPFYLVRAVTAAAQLFSNRSLYDLIFITGRATCAVFGLLAIALTWLVARQVFKDSIIGLTAAALLGFNFLHLQLSRFYTSDIILTTTCLIALYGMVLLFEKKSWTGFSIAVAGTGMSLATKVSALMLFPFLALALLLAGTGQMKFLSLRSSLARLNATDYARGNFALLGLLGAMIVALLLEPYAVLDYAKFRHDTLEQIGMARGDWRPPYTVQYEHTTPYLYHLKQIFWYTTGWPVTLAMAGGAILFMRRIWRSRMATEALLLAWPIVFFFSTAGLQVKFPRYLLPIYPPLLTFAAFGLSFLLRKRCTAEGTPDKPFESPIAASEAKRPPGILNQFLLSLQDAAVRRASLVVILILGVAFLLRVVNVTGLPYPLHNDEMNVGLEARRFLSGPQPRIFGTGWLNYPQTAFYAVSYFLGIFGDGLFGLRMYAVTAGIFSLIGLFFLAREISGVKTALLALAFASLSHLHLHYSRAGFIYMLPLGFSVWSLFFFLRASRSGVHFGEKCGLVWNSILGGGLAALCALCGGQGWTVLLAAVLWLLFSCASRKVAAARGLIILLFAAGAFACALIPYVLASGFTPLLLRAGESFILREHNLNHLRNALGLVDLGSVFQHQVLQLLRLFLWTGDNSMQYGFQGPWFDPAVLLLFVSGLVLALKRTWAVPSLVIFWLAVNLAFNHLLGINTPYSPRGLETVFAVSLLAACALSAVLERLQTQKAAVSLAAAAIAASAFFNLYCYFVAYPQSHQGMRRDEIVRIAAEVPGLSTIVNFFPEPENFDYESYRFMTPGVSGRNASVSAPDLDWQGKSLLIALEGRERDAGWNRGRDLFYRLQGP